MREKMIALYTSVFNWNVEAAEDDYLKEFEEQFAPRFTEADTEADVQMQLSGLVAELYDDVGDENSVHDIFMDCGGTEELWNKVF